MEGFYEDDEDPIAVAQEFAESVEGLRASARRVTPFTIGEQGPVLVRLVDGTAHEVATHDAVNHPAHYTSHPSGVECIEITEHLNFCIGNAIKYLWRAGLKNDAIEDLRKAAFYVDREITRLSKGELA